MLNRLKNARPSAALVIAVVALFASLGGASYAAVSVTGKDVKNSSLTGKDVKNGSLAGKDVKRNSLGGKQILESGLGKVPSAGNADQAGEAAHAAAADTAGSAANADKVGGVQVKSFNFTTPGATSEEQILSLGGLQLSASCSGGGVLDFTANTTVDDSQIDSYSVEPDAAAPAPNQNQAFDSSFDIVDTKDLVPDDEDDEVGQLRYAKPDGSGVQVSWYAHHAGGGAGSTCAVNGVATAF
jgi:hypothetical protein